MTVAEQLNEMLKAYDTTTVPDQAIEPVQIPESDPETDSNQANNEVSTSPDDQNEVTESVIPANEVIPVTPPTPDPESEIDRLKREQVEMRQKMDEILSRQTTSAPDKAETTQQPFTVEEQDFIGDTDIDSTLNDPKELNKLLNKVFQKGIEIAEMRNAEIRSSLPEAIRTNVITLETLCKASEKFYDENKDLAPFKGAVASIFGEISTQHPEWDYEKLLKESEVETRKRLNLTKSVEAPMSTPPPAKDVPRLPRKGSQHRTTPDAKSSNPVLNEIAAMDAALL